MSHDTLSTKEREELLRMAGLSAEMVEAVEHTTTATVADAVVEHDTSTDLDAVVARILDRAAGNKDKALKLVDDHVQAEFDRIKVSKIQAAERGIDRTEHNRNAWAHVQKLRESMKTKVRAAFRDQGGFVKAKVKASKPKPNPDLDAFLLKHQDNDLIRQFLALQAQG